jgi:glycosyltransferase involved in cell wall biosynthesis
VIVVDDGSETPPEAVIALFRGRIDVTLIVQSHAGPSVARNTGVTRAKGQFLAFTDDDCAPDRDWLRTLAARFVAVPEHAIGGRIINALPANLYSTASQLINDVVYAYYNAPPELPRFFASSNLALTADRFREVGGFTPSLTMAASEDRDFCDRWLHHGYQMTYAPEVLVHHAHPLTLRTFWRQHFNYGRGDFWFHYACAWRRSVPLMPDLNFYLIFLRYQFWRAQNWSFLSLGALLVVWQVAKATGFLWEGVRHTARKVIGRKARSDRCTLRNEKAK